ncbi:MAG: F0F1 ATP synthase subunit A, partial [Alphaproteobacteria bacterium]|nr:F0F1 ATP synthase subunit A [Alphaproteobacteria bacterium]
MTRTAELAIEIRPLEQFRIEPLIPIRIGGLDVSYTNSALLMTIAVALITALMVLGTRKRALVPGRWQSVAEMSYEFVADMVDTNAGHGGQEFFPFVFTLFMFILFANFLGLVPYIYTVTSQIIVTFALAIVV